MKLVSRVARESCGGIEPYLSFLRLTLLGPCVRLHMSLQVVPCAGVQRRSRAQTRRAVAPEYVRERGEGVASQYPGLIPGDRQHPSNGSVRSNLKLVCSNNKYIYNLR
jgi:hypothetical protein